MFLKLYYKKNYINFYSKKLVNNIIIRAYSYAYGKITALKIKGATLEELALWQSNVHVQIWPERGFDIWKWADEIVDKKQFRQRSSSLNVNVERLFNEQLILQDRVDNIDFLTYWKINSINDITTIFNYYHDDDLFYLDYWDSDIVEEYLQFKIRDMDEDEYPLFYNDISFARFYNEIIWGREDVLNSSWYIDEIIDKIDDYLYETHEEDSANKLKNNLKNYQNQTDFQKEVDKFLKKQAVQLAFLETYWTIIGKLPRPPLEHTLFIPEWTLKLESTNYWLPELEDYKSQAEQSEIQDDTCDFTCYCYFGVNNKELRVYDTEMFDYDMGRFKKRKKNRKHQKMNRDLLSKNTDEVCLYNKSPFLLNICCRNCL